MMNSIKIGIEHIKKFRPSLRTAISIPFVLCISSIAILLSLSQYRQIQNIRQTESPYLLDAIYLVTQNQLTRYLEEPFLIQQDLAKKITEENLYKSGDLSPIYNHFLNSFLNNPNSHQYINAIGFGSELGETASIHRNLGNASLSLTLKDASTRGALLTYAQAAPGKIQAIPVDYDPRTTPWYSGFNTRNNSNWSPIDVSQDSRGEISISPSTMVKTNHKAIGVVTCNIKLNLLHEFLKKNPLRRSATILISDMDGKLVAQSDNSSILNSANDHGIATDRMYISQSSSPIIKAAAKWIKDATSKDDKKFSIFVDGEKFFGHIYSFGHIPGLAWKITILIPESDLLGNISSALQKTLLLVALIAVASIFAGLWVIERMTVSITRTAKAASLLSQGDLSVRIDHSSQIAETHTLINAFNHMSSVLQKTVVNLQGQVQFDEASKLLTRQGLSEKFMEAQPSKIATLCLVKLNLEKSLDNKPEQISSDLVLKAVSSRLLEKLPSNTACARIEGDVLAVLYTNLNDNENTHDYAILTQTVFEYPFIVENLEINLQTHIGFTSGALENRDLPLWIRNANQAMRKAIKKQNKHPENFNP